MKKLIFALAAVSLIAGGSLAYARDNSDGREKISHPGEIRNFDGIKRIGNSLWGHRKQAKSAMVSAEARTCVAAAITKKDAAVKSALAAFTASTTAAIDARTSCQINAIGLTTATDQQKANMTCTAAYKASAKANLKALGMARDTAWKTFRTEVKACSPASAEIKIEDGGDLESAL